MGPVWVAAGSGGTIATSPDGESWTEQVVGSGLDWTSVAFGNNTFLVASGASIYSSPDGYSWTLVGTSSVLPMVHLGSMWVGVDSDAAIYLSTDDGTSWTELRPSDGGPGYAEAAFALETP